MPGGLWDGGVPEPEDSTWVPVSKGSIRVPLRDLFLGSMRFPEPEDSGFRV